MSLFGPPDIYKLEAKRDVNGLIKALGYKTNDQLDQRHLREAALKALGRVGDTRAAEPLMAILKDQDHLLKWYAAEALGQIRDTRAVEPLIATLGGSYNENLYKYAAEALGKIRDTRAVKPLVDSLNSTTGDARMAVAVALDKLGWQPDKDETGAVYWIAKGQWDKCVEIGPLAVPKIIGYLKYDEDYEVRRAAADALGTIGDTRAVDTLIAALTDRDATVVEHVAWAIGKFRDARAVEPLIVALKGRSNVGNVAEGTTWALGQIGSPAVDALISIFNKEYAYHDAAREAAATALGATRDARAVHPLVAAVQDKDWPVRLRRAAAAGLGELGDVQAVASLLVALMAKEEDVREVTAEALGKIRDSHSLGPLIASLNDPSENVRKAAALAVGKIGDRLAVQPLLSVLNDPIAEVRQAAAEALDSLSWQPDTVETRVTYSIAKRLWDECVEIGVDAVGLLSAAVEDKNADVRKGAAEALGRLGILKEDEVSRITSQPFVKTMTEEEMLDVLKELCRAYANERAADTGLIIVGSKYAKSSTKELESLAMCIAHELNLRGGVQEMRRLWNKLEGKRGSRTLDMLWDGIGDWRG